MDEILSQIQQLKEQINLLSIQAKDILNAEEASEFLGLKKSYLYKMCQANEIPHFRSKGGKKIYFKRSDLEDWMLYQKVETKEEIQQKAIRRVAFA